MENYTKLFSLIKVAGLFGNARNVLRYMTKNKIKLTRKDPFLEIFGGTDFDPRTNTINIARKEIDGSKEPIKKLLHEFGHAINNKKGTLKKDLEKGKNYFAKDKKRERIANNNALNWITEPKDREAYKEFVKKPYRTHYDDTVTNYFMKKNTGKTNKNFRIENDFEKNISDNNFNSSIKPILRKKSWVR